MTIYRVRLAGGGGDAWAKQNADGTYAVWGTDGSQFKAYRDPRPKIQPPHGLPNVVANVHVMHDWEEYSLGVGECRPRIWRGENSPDRRVYPDAWAESYGAVSNLLRRLSDVFHYIEPNERNASAYGHETRQLLMIAAMEVESSWKAVLAANNYPGPERLTTKDYVALAEPMRLREWRIALSSHPAMPELVPFSSWDASKPTESLSWYSAYNAVKHDRESNFSRATLREAITSVAAAYIMVFAQFGELDNRHFLGLDEFRRKQVPDFPANERYVPPGLFGSEKKWKPVPLW
jgi:hypothetical protein